MGKTNTLPTAFDAKEFLRSVSNAPGVYAMRDSAGRYLYVGKAKDLKKRLSSYFRTTGLQPKTQAMMSHVNVIETTVTHTESEALLLENNLIKAERPRYNVVLRDDKSYPYIRLTKGERFPRLCFYRGSRKDAGRYFGPFPSAAAVRETLAQLQKVFPLRQCEDTFFRNRSRPCLQYQIERCSAPCVDLVDDETYQEDVRQAELFLEGRDKTLTKQLVSRMEKASKNLEFETAAKLRDRIGALQRIQEKQHVASDSGNVDVIAVNVEGGEACVEVMFIRHGRHLGNKHFFPELKLDYSEADILQAFIPQYYLGRSMPDEVLLSHAIGETGAMQTMLSEQEQRNVAIKHNARGQRARWLDLARLNVQDVLRRRIEGRATQDKRLAALQQVFSLEQIPQRIECFDVSHTAGEKTVASCVVFDSGGPAKSDYRRFNINGVVAGDDYGTLNDALTRRFRRLKEGEGKIPDVLLIDGGKGQLSTAAGVLEELQVSDVFLIGVAKGRTRKPGMEKLFILSRKQAVILDAASPALHLIQQIRDEAHRFAITGHRQRRGKSRTTSRLEEIPGVGERRRQALLKHLGGMREVARAGVEDLARVPGISPKLAQRIHEQLHH